MLKAIRFICMSLSSIIIRNTRLRELSTLTVPLLVEHAFITIMVLVNIAMVASLGEDALAAAGHINSASLLPTALFAAMITGGTVLVAQAIGAGDEEKAVSSGAQAVALATAFSLCLSIFMAVFQRPLITVLFGDSDPAMVEAGLIYFTYINWSLPFLAVAQTIFGVMRGAGDVKNPMMITLIMNGVNIVLSYALIIGISVPFTNISTPSFGMHGAGFAIMIARLVGVVLAVAFALSKKSVIRLNKWQLYKPTKAIQKDILTLGVPTGMEQVLFQVGRLLAQMMIIGMGTAAMAANVVAMNIMGLIMLPGNAITISIMVMVGQRVGRKEYGDISRITMFSCWVTGISMGVLNLILLPFGNLIGLSFNLDAESLVYFRWLYLSLIIGGPFLWPLSFIIPSALRAVKDVTFIMVASVVTMWFFRIVIGYYLGITLGLGVLGIWIGLYGDWGSRSVLFWIRMRRKKWLQKMIAEEKGVTNNI